MQTPLLLKEIPIQSQVNSVQNSFAKRQFAISRAVERMLRSVWTSCKYLVRTIQSRPVFRGNTPSPPMCLAYYPPIVRSSLHKSLYTLSLERLPAPIIDIRLQFSTDSSRDPMI